VKMSMDCPNVYMEVMRRTTKNFSQGSRVENRTRDMINIKHYTILRAPIIQHSWLNIDTRAICGIAHAPEKTKSSVLSPLIRRQKSKNCR
jgi:hypothetical protein